MSTMSTAPFDAILARAAFHAARLHHGRVQSEHVLLALLEDPTAVDVLRRSGLTAMDLADSIHRRVPVGCRLDAGVSADFPESPSVEVTEVSLCAQEEAEGFGHAAPNALHGLIALLREPEGMAGRLLESYGVGVDPLRHDVLECVASYDYDLVAS